MNYQGKLEFPIEEVNEKYVISKMPIQVGMLNPFGTVKIQQEAL